MDIKESGNQAGVNKPGSESGVLGGVSTLEISNMLTLVGSQANRLFTKRKQKPNGSHSHALLSQLIVTLAHQLSGMFTVIQGWRGNISVTPTTATATLTESDGGTDSWDAHQLFIVSGNQEPLKCKSRKVYGHTPIWFRAADLSWTLSGPVRAPSGRHSCACVHSDSTGNSFVSWRQCPRGTVVKTQSTLGICEVRLMLSETSLTQSVGGL